MTQMEAPAAKGSRIRIAPAVVAGLIAGAMFLMLEMALIAMTGGSPWGPPRMMAAIVMGPGVLPPPATFDMIAVAVAMMIHFPLSIVYALVFAVGASRLGLIPGLFAGAVFGLAIYAINFYGFAVVFPWFAMARNLVSIAGHVAFGMMLALVYGLLARRPVV